MSKRVHKIIGILIIIIILVSLLYKYSRHPVSYTDIIKENSEEYGVDPFLVMAIINVESKFDANARSGKDARGLMQITAQTGQWGSEMIGIEDYTQDSLYQPEINIKIGTWYINRLMKEFDGNLDLVLAAYNGGSGNVRKWLQNPDYSDDGINLNHIPFEETRNYLERVKRDYELYSDKHKDVFVKEGTNNDRYLVLLHGVRKNIKDIIAND